MLVLMLVLGHRRRSRVVGTLSRPGTVPAVRMILRRRRRMWVHSRVAPVLRRKVLRRVRVRRHRSAAAAVEVLRPRLLVLLAREAAGARVPSKVRGRRARVVLLRPAVRLGEARRGSPASAAAPPSPGAPAAAPIAAWVGGRLL